MALLHSIPTHEFLRLMENTKHPVKELTTEERLAEAVQVIREAEAGLQIAVIKEGKPTTDFVSSPKAALDIVSAFLKSIKG